MTITACDLCKYASKFETSEIEKALDEHYEQFPDSDWNYWDEIWARETFYCRDCPGLWNV